MQDLKDKKKYYGGEAYEQSRSLAEKEAFTYALHETMEYERRDSNLGLLMAHAHSRPAHLTPPCDAI